MSPEERAWNVIEENIYNVPTNGKLKTLIAAAIREAIAEEREVTLGILQSELDRIEWMQNNGHAADLSIMGRGILISCIVDKIRARSENALPEEIREGEGEGRK